MAAAVSLLQAGFDVHVYERAAAVSEVGAGIQVSPNASRVLHRLGLADELARMGVRPLAWHQRRWDDGRTLLRADLGDAVVEAFGFPHYQTHRADLLGALVGALPPERLHVGHLFRGLVDHGDRVEATFANGPTIEVDLLVGADGIHSAVREMLFGPQDPVFTGCAAYRGLVPAERLAHLDLEVTAQIWMGPGRHFVHYYVARRRLVNFVAIIEQDTLDARVVDRPRRPGRRDRRLRGLASAAPRDPARRRRHVHLGAVRSAAAAALVAGAGDPARATPATRCCRSWPRAPRRRSRTARRSRRA